MVLFEILNQDLLSTKLIDKLFQTGIFPKITFISPAPSNYPVKQTGSTAGLPGNHVTSGHLGGETRYLHLPDW